MKKIIITICLILALMATQACGTELLVPGQYPTIQDAIDHANDGDEIIVSIGTYYENIDFNGKNIILRSTEPLNPVVVANTVIDGRSGGSVVTFSGAESAACVLSGFKITNGRGTAKTITTIYGGGIYGNGTLATIQNSIITRNRTVLRMGPSSGWGGGIYNCDGTIQCNIISENSIQCDEGTARGGGLFGCDGIIQNNIISYNRVYGFDGGNHGIIGGGLSDCNGIIRNNTIYGNSAVSGGGLGNCSGNIINCIIWQNTANTAAQIYSSSTPSYSCVQDWSGGGSGNIIDNPLFVAAENNDFHLQSGSPCKDTATIIPDLTCDFEGDLRPLGFGYDIGADEFISNNLPPDKPVNISPQNGATNVSLTPTLTASAFSDPDAGDTHQASQWQVWIPSTGRMIFSLTKSSGDLSSITIPSRTLSDNISYIWEVRYQDQKGTWSNWSDPASFSTLVSGGKITVPGDYPTIQSAINSAMDGDEIEVWPGIYRENINFIGKNIILRSTDPKNPCVTVNTIIDGNQAGSVVTFTGTEPNTCVLTGFTITNGGAYRCGGGINGNDTNAAILNNHILRNLVFGYGGGIYRCNGKIKDNVIAHNKTEGFNAVGGGLHACHGDIQNNIIQGNSAISGGGLYACYGEIQNNIIKGNSAISGGGLSLCRGTIRNNIICKNSSSGPGGGIYNCGGAAILNNTICFNSASFGGGLSLCLLGTIENCIIWGNTSKGDTQVDPISAPIYFSCIQDWTKGGLGNISANPLFADPCNGDFHLLETSPCINTGDPNYEVEPNETDLEGKPRVIGGRIDMGAYEFNHLPIADGGPNQVAFAWIDGIADVTLDGSGSYDDDGDELTYHWTWSIDSNNYEANVVSPTIELPVGEHIVELIVNDGWKDSEPNRVIISVVEPLEGTLWIWPQIIHKRLPQRNIMAFLRLQRGITRDQIDRNSKLLLYPAEIEAVQQYIWPHYANGVRHVNIFAIFDRDELLDAIEQSGQVHVDIVGRLKTGQYFFGRDTIRIIKPPPFSKSPKCDK